MARRHIKGPLRDLIRDALAAGWEIERTGSNHLKFRRNGKMVIASGTPSDHRAIRNIATDLRRAERQEAA